MKMGCIIILFFLLHGIMSSAQRQADEPDEAQQQKLEDLSESTESETDDDYYMQQLVYYKDHPLDLNAEASSLTEFSLLEPLLIDNLTQYRRLLGDLISVYELQAVPGFTVAIIARIRPYVIIGSHAFAAKNLSDRLNSGQRSLTIRSSMTPERAKGFSSAATAAQRFQGGRIKIMNRYKYAFRDLLQYGVLATQDAGEKIEFRRQGGFDFYSFHVFARRLGIVKALAIGDFTVNLGQGLFQWQSQAFSKTSSVMNIKRQSETLRPYASPGEYNFFRGVGITAKKGNVESTIFASCRRISANTDDHDSVGKVITSIQLSGLHRTLTEIADRNSATTTAFGGAVRWQSRMTCVGVNAVEYRYSIPLLKRDEPYNRFAIKGNRWANYSVDYSFTWRNLHNFGEWATDRNGHVACINGMMASLDKSVDVSLLVRAIGRAYQSLYGNAFTENTMPSNENGVYMGCSVKPSSRWNIDVYADLFRFPWLRFRDDAPGFGSQYLVQVAWHPNKRIEVYSRLRMKRKPLNDVDNTAPFRQPVDNVLRNWRTHVDIHVNRSLQFRGRMEWCWFMEAGHGHQEKGFLFFTDGVYKPIGKPVSFDARIQLFRTDSYNTRLYAYENDVLFANSTPVFFDKGARVYINMKARIKANYLKGYELNAGIKLGRTFYNGSEVVGSGVDAIAGNHKSEMKLQLYFTSA